MSKTSLLDKINYPADLRKWRKRNFKSIAVVKIPNTEIGCAINDRLRKASNKWTQQQLRLII